MKKDQQVIENKQNEQSLFVSLEELKNQIKDCKNNISEKIQFNEKSEKELSIIKNSVDVQNKELSILESKLGEINEKNDKIHFENKNIIQNIDNESQIYLNLQSESQNRKKNVEIWEAQHLDIINQMNCLQNDILKHSKVNSHLMSELEVINDEKNTVLIELDNQIKSKECHKKELDRMKFQNIKLMREKNFLIEKGNELENNLNNLERKASETMNLLDSKDKIIEDYKKKITNEEIISVERNEEILMLQKEELVIKDRIDQINSKVELSLKSGKVLYENKNLAILTQNHLKKKHEILDTEYQYLENDFSKLKDMFNNLQESTNFLKNELDALQKHSCLLEHQNYDVFLISYIKSLIKL